MELDETLPGIYRINVFGPSVTAAFSGRNYDNSKRGEYLQALSLDPKNLVTVKQVHSDKVLAVHDVDPSYPATPADGLVTDKKGIVLGVRTADCVPVFFYDPVNQAVGVAHGGWKGVKGGIVSGILTAFEKNFGTKTNDLRVVLGPAIRACCYEVGREFSDFFPGFFKKVSDDKGHLDLTGVIRDQLAARGVLLPHIQDTGLCTVCQNGSFYSYRVERQTQERILSVISLLPD